MNSGIIFTEMQSIEVSILNATEISENNCFSTYKRGDLQIAIKKTNKNLIIKFLDLLLLNWCATDLRAKANSTVEGTATRLQTETHEQRLNRLQTVLDFLCVFWDCNVLYFPKSLIRKRWQSASLRRSHFASVLQGHYPLPRKWVMFDGPR